MTVEQSAAEKEGTMKPKRTEKHGTDGKMAELLKRGQQSWRKEFENFSSQMRVAMKSGRLLAKLRTPTEAPRGVDPKYLVPDRFDSGESFCEASRDLPSRYLWSSPDKVTDLSYARQEVSRTHNPAGRITGLMELEAHLLAEDTDVPDEGGFRCRAEAALIQLAVFWGARRPGLFSACARVLLDGTTLFLPRKWDDPHPLSGWAYSELDIRLRATGSTTSESAYSHAEVSSGFPNPGPPQRFDRRLLDDVTLGVSMVEPPYEAVLVEIYAFLMVGISTNANFSVDSAFTNRPGRVGIYIPYLLNRYCPEID
jgi:hypothetical protein